MLKLLRRWLGAFWNQVDRRVVVTSLVFLLLSQGLPWAYREVTHAIRGPERPTVTDLASLVGAGFRVTERHDVDLDGASPDEVTVVAVRPAEGAYPPPQGKVLVIAWDKEVRRWEPLFDSSRFQTTHTYFFGESEVGPFFPKESTLAGEFHLDRIGDSGSHELLLSTNIEYGNSTWHVAVIIGLDHNVPQVLWDFSEEGPGTTRPTQYRGRPAIETTVPLYFPWTGHCCSKSDFTRTWQSTPDGLFRVVHDTTPILGAFVTLDETNAPVVIGTVPGSPADGKLLVGDRLLQEPLDTTTYLPKERWLDNIVRRPAGASVVILVERGTDLLPIQLVTSEKGADRPGLYPPAAEAYLGVDLEEGVPGAFVRELAPSGPFARAGIPIDASIESMNGKPVLYPADAWAIASSLQVGTPVPVVFTVDGKATTVQVTPDYQPLPDDQDHQRIFIHTAALI